MYGFALLVVAVTLLSGSVAQAARYKKTDGTFVDPILDTGSWKHRYSGVNLEPNADLNGADLTNANLTGVSSGGIVGSPFTLPANWQLTSGYLIGPQANLTAAALTGATLSGATLTGATLTSANLHQALLPSAMPSLPVVNGAVVTVSNALSVSGSVQVDTGGILSVTSDTFTTTGVNMQGGRLAGATFGLDLDQIGNISGHGRLFGDVDLGTDGAIAGSGAGRGLHSMAMFPVRARFLARPCSAISTSAAARARSRWRMW